MSNTEERMKILKMIDEGKLSAEEGAKLLSALNNSPKPSNGGTVGFGAGGAYCTNTCARSPNCAQYQSLTANKARMRPGSGGFSPQTRAMPAYWSKMKPYLEGRIRVFF